MVNIPKAKHNTNKVMKKFSPHVIGNERAKLLSDSDMMGMHKSRKVKDNITESHVKRTTMLMLDRED
jgi:hypothetical protein